MKRILFLFCVALPLIPLGGYASDNLVKDPGFEQGGVWKTSPSGGSIAAVVENGFVSKKCGYIKKVNDGKSHYTALTQTIDVEPKKKYLLSAMIKGKGVLFFYGYDKQGRYTGNIGAIKINCKRWLPVAGQVLMPANVEKVVLRFEIYGKLEVGECWVDDLYFGSPKAKLPAPTGVVATIDDNANISLKWDRGTKKSKLKYYVFISRYPDILGNDIDFTIVKKNSFTTKMPTAWKRCYMAVKVVDETLQFSEFSKIVTVENKKVKDKIKKLVWTCSPLNKVRRYRKVPLVTKKPQIDISLAGNETEAGQAVIFASGKEIKNLSVSISALTGVKGNVADSTKLRTKLYFAHYAKVERTIASARSGLMPDALLPAKGSICVPRDANQLVWLSVHAAGDCPAGKYSAKITLKADSIKFCTIPVSVKVFNFSLPEKPSYKSAFAIWPRFLAQAYKLKEGTKEFGQMWEKYYWFIVNHRFSPGDLPVALDSPDAKKFLDSSKVTNFRLRNNWMKVEVDRLRKQAEILKKNNWIDKGYVYCIDEPGKGNYRKCGIMGDKVHFADKDLKMLLTAPPTKSLEGKIDIWVPILTDFNLGNVKRIKQAGREYWWYRSCAPQDPFPTYLIDDIGVSHRVLSWLQFRYGVEGVLYWAVNIWSKFDSKTRKYSNTIDVWGNGKMYPGANGDGFLVYPGTDGPITTIRLEIICDGNEDFEYLTLLRNKLKAKGLSSEKVEAKITSLIEPVASSLTKWSREPEKLNAQRKKIAEMIEKL